MFNNENIPFLYHAKELKGRKKEDMRPDLQLTISPGRAASRHTLNIDDVARDVLIRFDGCTSCKKCPEENCSYGQSKRNPYPDHKSQHKVLVACRQDCPAKTIFIM